MRETTKLSYMCIKASRVHWVVCILVLVPCVVFSDVTSEVHYMIEFPLSDLQIRMQDGYDIIQLNGLPSSGVPGKPFLPAKSIAMALPQGTKARSVEARSISMTELAGEYYVMPGQPPLPIGQYQTTSTVPPDPTVYDSYSPYPGDIGRLDGQSNCAGQQIAWVTVSPVQYIPAARKLLFHTQVEVVLHCTSDNPLENHAVERYHTFTDAQQRLYKHMLKTTVVNPEAVQVQPYRGGPSFSVTPGTYDHVIITSNANAAFFEPLTFWHTKKGMKDTVVTTEWIYSNYTGPSDTLKIRQFVSDANTTWGTMYFLIGGEGTIVPYGQRTYYAESLVPGDQYYADFDDDWIHEVFVGRVSVDNGEQITRFVSKVLKYEKDPPRVDYPTEVLFAGFDLDETTPAEQAKDSIAKFLPANFMVHKVYDSYGGNHADSTRYYLNHGVNLMNHDDHADETHMCTGWIHHRTELTNADIDNLVNDNELSVIISNGCHINAMQYEDCVGEHFVVYNDNQAGVAFIGNTGYGWYYNQMPISLTSEIDMWWWYGLFRQNYRTLGEALVYAKHQFANNYDWDFATEWNMNLLGEPAMPVWTDAPTTMLVTHSGYITNVPQNFTVTVKEADGVTPIADALVCYWIPHQNPELYVRGYTDNAGQATLNVHPTTPGDTMQVTVTKQNYVPYEGNVLVIYQNYPFIIVRSTVIKDFGNGDGKINPADKIQYGVWAKNIGSQPGRNVTGILSSADPYVQITTSSSKYGTIPPGDTILSSPFYAFTVKSNCPNKHEIQFDLTFRDKNDSVWISHPKVTVYSPILTFSDVRAVNDDDHDNALEPGEAADLIVALKNEGDATAEYTISRLTSQSPYITMVDSIALYSSIAPGVTVENTNDHFRVRASSETPYCALVGLSMIVMARGYTDTVDFTVCVGAIPPTDTGRYYAYWSGGHHPYSPVFDWVAIDSSQTQYPGVYVSLPTDTSWARVILGFSFKYYGGYSNTVYISPHGWISNNAFLFGPRSNWMNNSPIPDTAGPVAMIAALWDYLEPRGAYWYKDTINHRFIVEYCNVEHKGGGAPESFEIILYDPWNNPPTPTGDGEILVQYLTAPKQQDITIGIENRTEKVGIQYFYEGTYHRCAGAITDSFAILYSTVSPFPAQAMTSEVAHSSPAQPNATETLFSPVCPNPFSRTITMTYQVETQGTVRLKIYDATGRQVRSLADGMCEPGMYTRCWDGCDNVGRRVPAGVYFVRFETNNYSKVEKAILLR